MISKRTSAGFSLVELMCAILILGIALVGLTQGLTTALSSSRENALQAAAALLAAGQVETLRAEGFISEGETEGEGDEGMGLFRWKQTVSKAELNGLYEVEVIVENAKTGQAIYELRTLLFEVPADDTPSQDKDKLKDNGKIGRQKARGI